MEKIAIIGAGVSGLSSAQLLKKKYDVTVFEAEKTPGGLIRCERVNGNLFHTCGGHVFNSKRQDVLEWFWGMFNRDIDFLKAERNSVVFMDDNKEVPYPIENHMYYFDEKILKAFSDDLVDLAKNEVLEPGNFEDFLKGRFGDTLYKLYFQPYNEKVWRRDLKSVPLSWLVGKLPMPTVSEMIYNNIGHVKEKEFVHSSFWYEKNNGSQFLANRLAEGINVEYSRKISQIELKNEQWLVDGLIFDKVIFCGNIKDLPQMLHGIDISNYADEIKKLEYHGTTSVFCEIDKNPYSWIYLPSKEYESHRVICTGNFARSNNANVPEDRITATIEFTDKISKENIIGDLMRIPLSPKYLDHKYNKYTYPIQDSHTREMIMSLKDVLKTGGFFLTGRFADWEYYNMDAAMGAAMDLVQNNL